MDRLDEFKNDMTFMCNHYGGFSKVLEYLTEWQKEMALEYIEVNPNLSKCYAKMAYLLTELHDFWLSF